MRNGKFFFIRIPWDPISGGWLPLLRAIQPWFAEVGPDPLHRSFAEVVRRPSLSGVGRCLVGGSGTDRFISVDKDGVQDRLDFLECCLVLRFAHSAKVDWEQFRKWAVVVWGVPKDVPVLRLADDLWMLVCSSKSEVLRVVALRKWRFGDVSIQMDPWIAQAGLSVVGQKEGVGWIEVSGIPVHLRSPSLFSALGELCGGFVDFEDGRDLNSIRLKVKTGGEVPREAALVFGKERFVVSFQAEMTGEIFPAVVVESSSGAVVAGESDGGFGRPEAEAACQLGVVCSPFQSGVCGTEEAERCDSGTTGLGVVCEGVIRVGMDLQIKTKGLERFRLAFGPWAFSSGLTRFEEREGPSLQGSPLMLSNLFSSEGVSSREPSSLPAHVSLRIGEVPKQTEMRDEGDLEVELLLGLGDWGGGSGGFGQKDQSKRIELG
ncbi:hypothetical protein LINPERHAP2_LOCUS8526 [Linum perenne]